MDQLLEAFSVIGMLLLRMGVPVAVTIGAVYAFRRMDMGWQTQDWQHWSERLQSAGGVAGEKWLARLSHECWDENSCEESAVAKCAAHAHQEVPCWMARRAAAGTMPAKCFECERYTLGAQIATD